MHDYYENDRKKRKRNVRGLPVGRACVVTGREEDFLPMNISIPPVLYG